MHWAAILDSEVGVVAILVELSQTPTSEGIAVKRPYWELGISNLQVQMERTNNLQEHLIITDRCVWLRLELNIAGM